MTADPLTADLATADLTRADLTRADLTTAEVADPDVATLRESITADLVALEEDPGFHLEADASAAADAERRAADLGADDLVRRARLLRADVLLRLGRTDEAGQLIHRVHAWAEQHGEEYLLARSHRGMFVFYRQVGDLSVALTHAVQAVAHLTEEVSPIIRARNLLALAVVLDETGSTADADRRFREGLDIAPSHGYHKLALYILNAMAFTAYEHGDEAAALDLVARMREVHDRSGEPLTASHLDTIARTAMMGHHYDEADRLLTPLLVDGPENTTVPFDEGSALAECMLTLAEARHLAGDTTGAQQVLDLTVRLCEERNLGAVRTRAREQQAALFASLGEYRDAYEEHQRFHAESRMLFSAQAEARARAMQAVFEADEARRSSEHFREMANRDALTGLHNRRYVDEKLPVLLGDHALRQSPLSVAIVDLDHFKRINDTLSHDTGDAVLRHVARLLDETATGGTVAARLGGEEFLLIFPGVDAAGAAARCETLRHLIRTHDWSAVTGGLPVTASIGVADGRHTPSELLARADRNLYAAKRSGRDRVVTDTPPPRR